MPDGSSRNGGLFDGASYSGLVFDAGLIGVIALVVIGVHVLVPSEVRARLAFDYMYPDPLSAFTSALVHYNTVHLLSNTVGYLIAVSVACVLSRQAGRKRWFRSTVIALVVILPVSVNLTSYMLLTTLQPSIEGAGRGFSGVTAGVVGLLFVALLAWLDERYSPQVAWSLGTAIFIGLLLEVAVIYTKGVPFDIFGLGMVGIALSVWQLVENTSVSATTVGRSEMITGVLFVGLIVVLLGLFVFSLFPASIVQQGKTTNIISHGAGFIYGIVLSGVLYHIHRSQSISMLSRLS